jgi:hypothetical protein
LRKRKHLKQQKKYINQLINIIENNEDYKAFIETDKRYRKFIEQKNQLTIWEIIFFDIYDNKKLNKLVKRISKLNKNKYKVDLTLKPKKFKDLSYLNLQYDRSSITSLATVEFIDDKFIKEITATFVQINNNQAIVEFKVHFNKIMDNKTFLAFIKDNKENLYKKSFVSYYDLDMVIDSKDFSYICRMFEELVKLSIQAKLMEIFKLNFGEKYKLPSCIVINYPEGLYDKESFKNVFLCETIEIHDGEQYLIIDITSREGLEMELYFSGKFYRPLTFTNIISNYRMDFYYFLFDKIEQYELNQKMNKYFNESKNRISSKDYKWLVNKIRTINDNKLHMSYKKTFGNNFKEWRAFYDGKEKELAFSDNSYTKKYETIYTECLEHIKIIYALQKENLIIKISSWSLIATLIGIIITIFQNYIQKLFSN